MSLMSKIRDWFKGGNTNRSTSTRGTTRTTTTSTNRSGVRQIASQVDNSAEEERKRRIKEAFAESNKKAEEARAKARTDAEKSKYTFANTQVAKKKTNVAKQELDAMAKAKGYSGYSKVDSLDRKYMQEDEKISAKNNPLAYTFAKSAANGAMLNLPKVVEKYGTSDAEKKHQAQVNKIVHQNATDKQIKRAELGGEIVGSFATFGTGSGASRAIASMPKVAPKVAQMSNKLATTEAMKKLGARMIEKGAFKGTVEQAARHYSEKLATELTADAILDHSMSLADSTNRAITTEGDINDKVKAFLVNQGLNVGISGAIDIAPAVLKSMKGSGALKAIREERANNVSDAIKQMEKERGINRTLPRFEKVNADGTVLNPHTPLNNPPKVDTKTLIERNELLNNRAKSFEKAKELMSDTPENKSFVGYVESDARAIADEKASLKADFDTRLKEISEKRNKLEALKNMSSDEGTKASIDRDIIALTEEENALKKAFNSSNAKANDRVEVVNDRIEMAEQPKAEAPVIEPKAETDAIRQEPPVEPVPKGEEIPWEDNVVQKGSMSNEELEYLERNLPPEQVDRGRVAPPERSAETTNTTGLKMDNVEVSNVGKNDFINQHQSVHDAFDMKDVLPAKDHEAAGHYGEVSNASPLQTMYFENQRKQLQNALDKDDKRYVDSATTNYKMSKDAEYRKISENAAAEQAREQGLMPQDFNTAEHPFHSLTEEAVLRKDKYNAVYNKLSYKQMLATAWEDVCENPKAVMEALYDTLRNGKRFTAGDLGMAASLVRYGDTYGVSAASDLGHIFMIEYANEVGRLSGMYQFVAKQWNYLTPKKKLAVMDRQMEKLSKELGFPDYMTMANKVNEQQVATKTDKNGNSIIDNLLDMRKKVGEDCKESDFVNICLDNICNSTDEEVVNLSKEILFDAFRNSVDPTLLSTLTSWRYLSMLCNPRTHIRNVTGNAAFFMARGLSDVFETSIQKFMKGKGVIDYQTRAFLTPTELKELATGKGKYGEAIQTALDEDIASLMKQSEGRFSAMIRGNANSDASMLNKVIDKGNDFNGNLLESEDEIFVRANYKKSFYQFLKANGYGTDRANIAGVIENGHFSSEEDLFEAARAFAQRDAVEATFRNHTEFSMALSKLTRRGLNANSTGLQKGVSLVTNALVPFTTTPANILVAGFKFSPIGLANGSRRVLKALKSGDPEVFLKSATDFAEGLTGTGVALLGFFWGRHAFDEAGLSLSTSTGDDDKAKAYKRAGVQNYSLVYNDGNGNGWSYSLDWCSPMAQTLFMGAEVGRNMQASKAEGNTIFDREDNLINVASKLLDPVLEMSMLQGINGFIEGASQDSEKNGLSAGALNLARTYLGSFIPSVLGSFNRTFSKYDYETVGTSATEGGNNIEYWVNSQLAKVPILSDKLLAQKVNEKGQVVGEKNGAKDYAKAALQNFISPGNFKRINMSESDQEAFKLYDELVKEGDEYAGDVFAKVDYGTDKRIGQKSKKYGIAPDELKIDKFERAEWNKDRATNGMQGLEEVLKSKAWNSYYGKDDDKRNARASEVRSMTNIKSSDDALNWLISQPEYKNADNSEKKEMIKQVLNDARDYSANKTLYMNRGNSEADYRFKVDLPAKAQAQESAFKKAGISKEDVLQFFDKAKKVSYSDDGTPHTSYSKKNMYAALNGMNLSEEQKALLYNTFKTSNAKEYGASGSGGRRRGSSGGSKKTAKQSSASKSAFKVSVKDSDYKSIVDAGSTTEQRKIAKSLGLSDEEIKAIIKQANRENLKLKG